MMKREATVPATMLLSLDLVLEAETGVGVNEELKEEELEVEELEGETTGKGEIIDEINKGEGARDVELSVLDERVELKRAESVKKGLVDEMELVSVPWGANDTLCVVGAGGGVEEGRGGPKVGICALEVKSEADEGSGAVGGSRWRGAV
ncbi:hypothetical protein B0H12DRAFT_1167780 [Mycena haematopus]|nr:hypothetical protein B0H12DRAFT_1167780 [Mycena haematopus]